MSLLRVLLVGRAISDVGTHRDEARPVVRPGGRDGRLDGLEVVAVRHALGVPAVGIEALEHVLGPRHRGRAIELDAKLAEAYVNRGCVHFARADYDAAIRDFTEAIRLGPHLASAYANRGNALSKKGKHDEAIRDLTEAVRLEPNDAQTLTNRGCAYAEKRDHGKAIDDFSRAIELQPDYAPAYRNRGGAHHERGDTARARADYQAALRLDPGNTSLIPTPYLLP